VEQQGFGEGTVHDRVEARAVHAGLGFAAAGYCAVGAGGADAAFAGHFGGSFRWMRFQSYFRMEVGGLGVAVRHLVCFERYKVWDCCERVLVAACPCPGGWGRSLRKFT